MASYDPYQEPLWLEISPVPSSACDDAPHAAPCSPPVSELQHAEAVVEAELERERRMKRAALQRLGAAARLSSLHSELNTSRTTAAAAAAVTAVSTRFARGVPKASLRMSDRAWLRVTARELADRTHRRQLGQGLQALHRSTRLSRLSAIGSHRRNVRRCAVAFGALRMRAEVAHASSERTRSQAIWASASAIATWRARVASATRLSLLTCRMAEHTKMREQRWAAASFGRWRRCARYELCAVDGPRHFARCAALRRWRRRAERRGCASRARRAATRHVRARALREWRERTLAAAAAARLERRRLARGWDQLRLAQSHATLSLTASWAQKGAFSYRLLTKRLAAFMYRWRCEARWRVVRQETPRIFALGAALARWRSRGRALDALASGYLALAQRVAMRRARDLLARFAVAAAERSVRGTAAAAALAIGRARELARLVSAWRSHAAAHTARQLQTARLRAILADASAAPARRRLRARGAYGRWRLRGTTQALMEVAAAYGKHWWCERWIRWRRHSRALAAWRAVHASCALRGEAGACGRALRVWQQTCTARSGAARRPAAALVQRFAAATTLYWCTASGWRRWLAHLSQERRAAEQWAACSRWADQRLLHERLVHW